MELENKNLSREEYLSERESVMTGWRTGEGVSLEEGFRYQHSLPEGKKFAHVLNKAVENNKVLIQPRAGVALVDEHIKLLKYLEEESDLLPTTIDAYTRQNRYAEAEEGIRKSRGGGALPS